MFLLIGYSGKSGLSGISSVFSLSQGDRERSRKWNIPGIGMLNAYNSVVRWYFKMKYIAISVELSIFDTIK